MGLCSVIRWADRAHFDALANNRHLRTGQGAATEVGRTEALRIPLLPRIRGPFQRDREPHGEYRVEAVKEVSLIIKTGPTE